MLNTLLIDPTKSGPAGAPSSNRADTRESPSSDGNSFESHVRQQGDRGSSKATDKPKDKPDGRAAAKAPAQDGETADPKKEAASAAPAEEAGQQLSESPEATENAPKISPETLLEPSEQVPAEEMIAVPVSAGAPAEGRESAAPAPQSTAELAVRERSAAAVSKDLAATPAMPVQPETDAKGTGAEVGAGQAADELETRQVPLNRAAPVSGQAAAAQAAGIPLSGSPLPASADAAESQLAAGLKVETGKERVRTASAAQVAAPASAHQMTPAAQAAPVQPLLAGEAAKASAASADGTPQDTEAELDPTEVQVTPAEARSNRSAASWRATAPVPQPAVQQAAQQAAMTASGLAMQMAMAESGADTAAATLLSGELLGGEPTGLNQLLTEAMVSPGTVHRPEVPRMVAQQMAEAVAAKGDRNIEIALSPEELGRVKMRLSATDSGVSVMITTERPETGDLMRKHINELAEEFRRMGYEDVSFEFSGESAQDGGGENGEDSAGGSGFGGRGGAGEDDVSDNLPIQQTLRLGETGLDMRM